MKTELTNTQLTKLATKISSDLRTYDVDFNRRVDSQEVECLIRRPGSGYSVFVNPHLKVCDVKISGLYRVGFNFQDGDREIIFSSFFVAEKRKEDLFQRRQTIDRLSTYEAVLAPL